MRDDDDEGVVVGGRSETADLREAFEDLFAVEEIQVEVAAGRVARAVTIPRGVELKSLRPLIDEFRLVPERTRGTAAIADLESFLAHVGRFQDAGTAIFANPDAKSPSLLAVYDYSQPKAPRFGEHRARYTCPLSDEWQAWMARDGQLLTQADFAVFLEDRIGDVIVENSAVQRDRLLVDSLKWLASRTAPRHYGDKVDLGGGGTITVHVRREPKRGDQDED